MTHENVANALHYDVMKSWLAYIKLSWPQPSEKAKHKKNPLQKSHATLLTDLVWAFEYAVLRSPNREYQRGDGSSTTKQINSVRPSLAIYYYHICKSGRIFKDTHNTHKRTQEGKGHTHRTTTATMLKSCWRWKLLQHVPELRDRRTDEGRETLEVEKAFLVIVCCPPFLDTLIQLLTHIDSTRRFVCVCIQQCTGGGTTFPV